MVPSLGVLPLKRLWAGAIDNEGIAREMEKYEPGLILLKNDGSEMPFQELLNQRYRLTYLDAEHRLYVLNLKQFRSGHQRGGEVVLATKLSAALVSPFPL